MNYYRNKIYVAFDGDNDITYYELLRAWHANGDFEFNDAHDLNTSKDSSKEESIKHNLSIRLKNSKAFIILIGEHTKYLTKFVKWEIEQAIRLDIPIIAVNLNKSRIKDYLFPNILNTTSCLLIPFEKQAIRDAINSWPDYYKKEVPSFTNKIYFPQ